LEVLCRMFRILIFGKQTAAADIVFLQDMRQLDLRLWVLIFG